ncbi:hypothetical protein [Amycolatopsis sp. PS_44_ISF1]|uniref:hypothetical protein n=1 Tax=Amycolatopsis sp. PS_44_ISF1 TaxID=2974917 RepID=UPI0028E079E8|nr:hypothetical protein [Amycolatopsis sp. PS_44_ISF1]MDT8913016.1 hypothetical protein [Amycolatopsis sp. PS_44_ISF1]
MRVHSHAPGPAGHGVVRHARSVARLCAARGVSAGGPEPDLTHAHFTDALFGPTIDEAARAYRAWAARARRPLVVTVHDVPDPAGRGRRDLARCAGYTAVLEASDSVIVSAEHEAAKVARLTAKPVHHIDLPLPAEPAALALRAPEEVASSLVVLGYLYPGKGHREAIDVAAAVGRDRPEGPPGVFAAGTASAGHDELAEQLRVRAEAKGVPFVITGHLTDDRFAAIARAAGVPLVLNREVSASGSLLSWLSCQRRPITWAGPYSREIERRYPGNLALAATSAELAERTARALADPRETRLAEVPRWRDIGAEHVALYRRVLAAHEGAPCSPTS